MKLPKYVQAWVDGRDGRAYYYLRRRGFPRVRLPGLPWSPSFMAAYEAALTGPHTAIGAGRIKPGSVAAVVAEYLDSQQFFASKSAGTQRMRRGILERFRAAYGDRPFALLPPQWIEALLDATPGEHLTFLVTATGKPYGGTAFTEQFRNWCDAAGLPQRCKPHGLRKAACRRLAEAGCSANEIMAISGHATMKELVRYTAAADQARLARNAMAKAVIR